VIAFIQRIYSRLTGVPSSAIRMEFGCAEVGCSTTTLTPGSIYCDDHNGLVADTGDYGFIGPPPRRRRGRVDEDAATGREAQEEDY